MKKPVRTNMRRLYIAEGTYFITAVTSNRQPIFARVGEIQRLRHTIRCAKEIYPFSMRAYVFLPDHFHLALRVAPGTNISALMKSIKRNYTLDFKHAHRVNKALTLWQTSFWDHVIRDEQDFKNHLDYIHYNPVKHGYVTRPENWPHTSYLEYVSRQWYELGWGHIEPEDIPDLSRSEPA